MHFTRLRLAGFKSFVEPTELLVEPGLTGIVGPNGCGKSNLVEALRWVMGENSAKKMRGDGMDDVIFNGSAHRPPRNLAEVSLLLDNADRSAPAAFNDSSELEVVRRIERESGSAYAINGAEARAKDVQLLFADLSTGAHSTALVSQGQIGMLIQSKPTARRSLIEEAAGITGLHTRRHEAELRLKAAETNLERLADVVETMESQLRALERQARQASRYSRLSGHIRTAEARLFLSLWSDAQAEAQAAAEALAAADRAVSEATGAAAQASSAQLLAQEKVPPLRQTEAESAARLHRLTMERENLEAEEERARTTAANLQDRIRQITADQTRERDQAAEAEAKAGELDQEQADHEVAAANEAPALSQSQAILSAAADALREGETKLDALTEQLTGAETGRASLAAEIDHAERRALELQTRITQTEAEQQRMGVASGQSAEAAVPEIATAREHADTANEAFSLAEDEIAKWQTRESSARQAFNEIQSRHNRVTAEAAALTEILAASPDSKWPSLTDEITVQAGYEAALAAALGDDLAGSTDGEAPVHWVHVEQAGQPPLPSGSQALSEFVDAPAALHARLSQIGVVAEGQGPTLRPRLAQGQRLVTKSGGLWRWDGFTSAEGTTTAAAVRMEQRNRLVELSQQSEKSAADLASAQSALSSAAAGVQSAQATRVQARVQATAANAALAQARDAQAEAISQAAARAERISSLVDLRESLKRDAEDIDRRQSVARAALADLPDADAFRSQVREAREQLLVLRETHRQAESAHHRLAAEAETRTRRMSAITAEMGSWRERAASANRHMEELASRLAAGEAELKILEAKPDEVAALRDSLITRMEEAEAERRDAADKLAEAETELAARDKDAKRAQQSLAEGREDRVRAEARGTQSAARMEDLSARIAEQLECRPDGLAALADLKEGQPMPDADDVAARLEKLKRERDTMGPVNLRAAAEALELSEQLAALASEREDLEGAIQRLRQGISSLNREGRQRMRTAFETVDGHFRRLFVKLFGGGEAHLALVDSDDPLEAGLEIVATLPGKRAQTLSLLSGGEQALTAVALRFAVFMTNPAPICVMDEVDAPLDDANVVRFCGLVDEIARFAETRFLVITHHATTMARMDRLYGVTMSERGVSQLVSVDLAGAERMREAS